MKYEIAMVALAALVSAEVPQEHSHEKIVRAADAALKLNNPLEIQDAVFALLGNAAAAKGAPKVSNLDCLQQIVADQAFTNGKAAGDLDAQTNAILFRALERNTGSVGLASVICNETAVNAEIAAVTQHQDPASAAAKGNADIELAVAKQLASIGADPQLALESATFAPGKIGDPTAKGNTCDDANDAQGCAFTLNLLVPAVSAAQIDAAVKGIAAGSGAGAAASSGAGAVASATNCAAPVVVTVTASADAAATTAAAPASGEAATPAGTNVQTFTGTLGEPAPAVISSASERPFNVGGSTFLNIGAAIQRSCDQQFNACANQANAGTLGASVADCAAQKTACGAAAGAAKRLVRLAAMKTRAAKLDFGACANPAIEFSQNPPDRDAPAFIAADDSTFSHGSALNIKVISDFICGQLQSKCKASAATVSTCQAASAKASSLKAQAAADAFNSALGVSA